MIQVSGVRAGRQKLSSLVSRAEIPWASIPGTWTLRSLIPQKGECDREEAACSSLRPTWGEPVAALSVLSRPHDTPSSVSSVRSSERWLEMHQDLDSSDFEEDLRGVTDVLSQTLCSRASLCRATAVPPASPASSVMSRVSRSQKQLSPASIIFVILTNVV